MPKDFDQCVKAGGRVRTIEPKKGRYIHLCYKGGVSHHSYVHKFKPVLRKK
jgi:hypothetical protein